MLKSFNCCGDPNRSLHSGPGVPAGERSCPSRNGMHTSPASLPAVTPTSASPLNRHALGGVFAADPLCPPTPPTGAQAVEIRDTAGRVIAYAWVVAEHADASLGDTAWSWLDSHDTGRHQTVRSDQPVSHLRLLPPR